MGLLGVAPDPAFNTAVSFLTNANWQAYAGEVTLSPPSQMAGLAVPNLLSAVTRAFALSGAHGIGSTEVDLTRGVLWCVWPRGWTG